MNNTENNSRAKNTTEKETYERPRRAIKMPGYIEDFEIHEVM